MVSPTLQLTEVFNIFHDGIIVDYHGTMEKFTLTIHCPYLGDVLAEGYENFYLELIGVYKLDFDPAMPSDNLEKPNFQHYGEFLDLNLWILDAENEKNLIKVGCQTNYIDVDFTFGYLLLSVYDFKLYDHEKQVLPLYELKDASNLYWGIGI